MAARRLTILGTRLVTGNTAASARSPELERLLAVGVQCSRVYRLITLEPKADIISPMRLTAVTSAVNYRRIQRARAWLESRGPAEEVLIVGATLDAANELARSVVKEKGAAFGWHRLTLSQLAAAIAAPVLAARGLVPLSRLGTEAIVARLIHRLKAEGGLEQLPAVADTPGFPRAIAGVIAELRLGKSALRATDKRCAGSRAADRGI